MAGDVGEQLARDRQQQLVLALERRLVDVDLDLEAPLACGLAGDRAQRLRESRPARA